MSGRNRRAHGGARPSRNAFQLGRTTHLKSPFSDRQNKSKNRKIKQQNLKSSIIIKNSFSKTIKETNYQALTQKIPLSTDQFPNIPCNFIHLQKSPQI